MHEWGGLTRFANSVDPPEHVARGHRRSASASSRRAGSASPRRTTSRPKGARRARPRARSRWRGVAVPDPLFPGLAPPAPAPGARTGSTRRPPSLARRTRRGRRGTGRRGRRRVPRPRARRDRPPPRSRWRTPRDSSATRRHRRPRVTTVVSGGDGGAGTAEDARRRVGRVDPAAVGRRAFEKARDSQTPRTSSPARYEVVLEPLAVSTLVGFLGTWRSAGARIAEGRSRLHRARRGSRSRRRSVTIVDDALAPGALGLPVRLRGNAEAARDADRRRGVPRRRATTGGAPGRPARESTGHALPAPNPEGPFPLNLFLEPGDASARGHDRGDRARAAGDAVPLLERRAPARDRRSPGMTRDGTWLIEDGEIAAPGEEPPVHAVDPGGALGDVDGRSRPGARERVLLLRARASRR